MSPFFFFLDLCQTQSINDAQQLADTIVILTTVIPNVHQTILNNVNYY